MAYDDSCNRHERISFFWAIQPFNEELRLVSLTNKTNQICVLTDGWFIDP